MLQVMFLGVLWCGHGCSSLTQDLSSPTRNSTLAAALPWLLSPLERNFSKETENSEAAKVFIKRGILWIDTWAGLVRVTSLGSLNHL